MVGVVWTVRCAGMSNFLYREEDHSYWFGDRRVPGATTVIGQWKKVVVRHEVWWVDVYSGAVVSDRTMAAASDRGSAVHLGARVLLEGGSLSWGDLPEDIAPYLRHVEEWARTGNVRPIRVETPLGDPALGYGGTLDVFCHDNRFRMPALVDIKSGMTGEVGLQTAAYENLIRVNDKYRGRIMRMVLDVKPGGWTYRPVGKATDFAWFKIMLLNYKYKEAV